MGSDVMHICQTHTHYVHSKVQKLEDVLGGQGTQGRKTDKDADRTDNWADRDRD